MSLITYCKDLLLIYYAGNWKKFFCSNVTICRFSKDNFNKHRKMICVMVVKP